MQLVQQLQSCRPDVALTHCESSELRLLVVYVDHCLACITASLWVLAKYMFFGGLGCQLPAE